MKITVPSKTVCERFLLIYELEGAQKAIDFLTEHYGIRRMKIVLDGKSVGRRMGKGFKAYYEDNKAYFSKKGLNKRNVLHEFYHHLVDCYILDEEEKLANRFAREVLTKART